MTRVGTVLRELDTPDTRSDVTWTTGNVAEAFPGGVFPLWDKVRGASRKCEREVVFHFSSTSRRRNSCPLDPRRFP
jgi:hypothetical protein